jgi:two-component system chemotaxis response regulator CheY
VKRRYPYAQGLLALARRRYNSLTNPAYTVPPGELFHPLLPLQENTVTVDKNMNVLVVDDYQTMIRIIKNLLKQLGFNNIDEATDGTTACEMLNLKKYGLVISDWNMEPMSGFDLLKKVRSTSGNDNITKVPFIMVTAESKTENVIAAKQAGVNNYIVKPFNAETLKTKIASVIGDF